MWTWDTNSNRKTQTLTQTNQINTGTINNTAYNQVFSYTLNSNRLTSQVYTNKVNATTTTHTLNTVTDIAGNITNDGNRLFTYNPLGRLSSFNYIGNTNITRYTYDIQNRRIAKIKPTTATVSATSASDTYVYAENVGGLNSTQLLGEYSNNLGSSIPVNKTEYVYLNDIPLAMVKNGVTYTIHTDHLNTPRQLTNATKQLMWNWGYTPFGDNQPNATTTSPVFNLRYPGQYYDPESKLHYNINRYYDPAMGRYTQSDPIGLNGGINTYTYVGGNGVKYIDPSDLAVGEAIVVGGIIIAIPIIAKAAEPAIEALGNLMSRAVSAVGEMCEKTEDYLNYKNRCNESPPSGLDKCETEKWKLERNKSCYNLRESYTNKWFNSTYDIGHWKEMLELKDAIKKSERRVRLFCGGQ
jgi:RHS repeat-associated protein